MAEIVKDKDVTIELEAILEYKNGNVYVRKLNVNELPATLVFDMIKQLNNSIIEYYQDNKRGKSVWPK